MEGAAHYNRSNGQEAHDCRRRRRDWRARRLADRFHGRGHSGTGGWGGCRGADSAICATCGSPVEGQFCAKCGGRVAAASSAASGPTMQASGAMADNVASALCYLLGLITGIIFLVLAPYNKNPVIRFHAFQSIFLHVACIVIMIGLNIVLGILHLWGMFFLGSLFWLAFFVLWIYLLIQAYQGKTIVLPVIGPLAQQQAGN